MVIAIAMLVSLVPMQALAYGAGYEAYEPSEAVYVGLPGEEEVSLAAVEIAPLGAVPVTTWVQLAAEIATVLPGEAATIALAHDIPTENHVAIQINGGREITLTSASGGPFTLTQERNVRHFIVNDGSTLILENVTLSGNYPAVMVNHGGVQVNAGGHLIMEDGSAIRYNRNTGNTSGAGVFVTGANARFTMNGGEISGNSVFLVNANGTTSGSAAVFVHEGGVFTMNGGVIRNNTGRFGGGVRIGTPAVFDSRMYMHGGEIYGNTARFGGGVNLERGTFTMTDGTIRNNTVSGLNNYADHREDLQENRGGGGVFIQNAGIFNMTGGTIHSNHSYNHGGGVMSVTDTNQFNMSGGTIRDNTAAHTGGGVRMTNGQLVMSGGTISGNTAASDGGGIWLGAGTATANARLNMTAGTISNNTATNGDGGGIFTATHNYTNPGASYTNILNANGTFSGNTAGMGRFAPPTGTGRSFEALLNNYNINFRHGDPLFSIIFNLGGGNVADNPANIERVLPQNAPIGANNVPEPEREHYTFDGWRYTGQDAGDPNLDCDDVADINVSGTLTFTAQWVRIMHEVTFMPGANGTLAGGTPHVMVQVAQGTAITAGQIPTVAANPGWTHSGWAASDPEGYMVTGSLTFTATYTQNPPPGGGGGGVPADEIHLAFMFGDNQGNFRPSDGITRAEVATVLARTQLLDFRHGIDMLPAGMDVFDTFVDVQPGNWHYYYVAWAYHAGLIIGDTPGADGVRRFRPNDPITRQEFAAMTARTTELRQPGGTVHFYDWNQVSGWAQSYVYTAHLSGWMLGDPTGTFRPLANINRAEVATTINRTLGRIDSWDAFEGVELQNPEAIRDFPDVEERWYFPSVVAASNDHRMRRDGTGDVIWKQILP